MTTQDGSSGKGIVIYTGEPAPELAPFRGESRLTITVKMLMQAANEPKDQGHLVINKSQVYMVQLCGQLTSLSHGDDWTDYVLYDGTGSVQGRLWSRDPEGWTDMSTATNGSYYIINGTVTTKGGEPRIATLTAREVTDHNEITTHFLTVIHEHLYLTDRYNEANAKQGSFAKARIEIDKEAILGILSKEETRNHDAGASEQELIECLNMDPEALRAALEEMLNEGSIYNTTDDKHFKLSVLYRHAF